MFYPLGGQMQKWKQHFGPSWGILFGHSVGFAARHAPNFKWVSASYAGSIWGQRWSHLGAISAIWGPTSAILGLCCRLYGIILDHVTSACSKTTPNYTSKKLSPVALEAQQNKFKKPIKNKNLLQNANLHGSKGKT